MSPGSSVIASERTDTRVATSKIMSSIEALCGISPFTRMVRVRPLQPSGSSSAVTSSGPTAPVPSHTLPIVHCGDLIW